VKLPIEIVHLNAFKYSLIELNKAGCPPSI